MDNRVIVVRFPTETFLFFEPFELVLGAKTPWARSPESERRAADPSLPSSTEVKNEWSYTTTHPHAFTTCARATLPLPSRPWRIPTDAACEHPSATAASNHFFTGTASEKYRNLLDLSSPYWIPTIQNQWWRPLVQLYISHTLSLSLCSTEQLSRTNKLRVTWHIFLISPDSF